jgi:hypothetical protein
MGFNSTFKGLIVTCLGQAALHCDGNENDKTHRISYVYFLHTRKKNAYIQLEYYQSFIKMEQTMKNWEDILKFAENVS